MATLAEERQSLLHAIREQALHKGTFQLSGGQIVDLYLDLRQVTCRSTTAAQIARLMLNLASGWNFKAVGGLTLGADPVAFAIMHASLLQGRPLTACIVRKEVKLHGLRRRVEGPSVAGRQVLVVEDTSTTGQSALTAVSALREAGANIVGVAAIVDRGARQAIEAAGLQYRRLFTLADITG